MLLLIEALNRLAAANPWPKEVPDARLPQILPTTAHVTAAKADDPATLAEGFGQVLAFELAPLIAAASTAGVLKKARTLWLYTGPARATDVTVLDGDGVIIKPNIESWERRLHLTGQAAALVAAIEALPVPPPPPLPPALLAAPAAFRALADGMVDAPNVRRRANSIREALDVLSRWVAAHRAAATFGGGDDVTALMLALYRTEGDLAVPRSQLSLEALIPATTESALQASRARDKDRKLRYQFGFNSLVHAADRPETEGLLMVGALALWALHIGGHDRLVGNLPSGIVDFAAMWPVIPPLTPMTALDLTNKFSSLANAMTVSRAYTDSSGLLKSSSLSDTSFATREIRVAPNDPVAVVQLTLELAYVLFLDLQRLRTVMGSGAPPTLRWTDDATYLFYNNQVQAITNNVITMPQRGLPASAAGACASWPKYVEPNDPTLQADFSELRTALGFIPLDDTTSRMWSAINTDKTNGPPLQTWLTTSSLVDSDAQLKELERRVKLLSLFMTRAGDKQWPTCREHRANTSRFRLLLSYYTEVLKSP